LLEDSGILAENSRRLQTRNVARVHELLDADEANTRVAPQLMQLLHPWAVEAFQDTSDLFNLLYRRIGNWPAEKSEDAKLREMAQTYGLADKEFVKRLNAGEATEIEGAEAAYARLLTFRVVKILVMNVQRNWAWAASDLFRLRTTSALGYLRLQTESVGLIHLCFEDPGIAKRWLQIRTKQDGQQFFHETQVRIKAVLVRFNLNNTYDFASGTSQHVRMASIVRGLRGGQMSLPDQDFNHDDPCSFYLAVAYFHRIQGRVLQAVATLLPDVRDDEWNTKESIFLRNTAELGAMLESRYARQIRTVADAAVP
jgi:hypothetical protein